LLKALNELISANGFDFTAIQETWCFMTMNARRKEFIEIKIKDQYFI